MKPIVSLQAFIQEMDVVSESDKAFLNSQTGELITLTDDEISAYYDGKPVEAYPEWQQERIDLAREVVDNDTYLPLPTKFDIHEYAIMEQFCYNVADEELSERLLRSIRGRGAFRYFKDTIHECGIVDDWYACRYQALREIAIDWLESRGISYQE